MNRALYAAASGMAAQQRNLETIAQNLANADVAGFKGSALAFEDIVAGTQPLGVQTLGSHTLWKQGKLQRSDGEFDLALDGPGFLRVIDDRGRHAFTRSGSFTREPGGALRNAQGCALEGIRVPKDAISLSVSEDGTVTATTAKGARPCGRIRVALFAAPERLRADDGTLFYATSASGLPANTSQTQIKFGMLEQSNVSIIEAMMQIMAAQRSYEANAKGVQAADEMMRIADNLQRS